jgi:membrane protease YdiL (CAAX protease family)
MDLSCVTVAVLSTSFFSILHLPHEVGILKAIAVFPGGLLLAYVRLKTGGVFWPMILHGLANTAGLVDWSKIPI